MSEVIPKIRHQYSREDVKMLKRLVTKFSQKMTDYIFEHSNDFVGWREQDNLVDIRKTLTKTVQDACYGRKDAVSESLATNQIDRRLDPYVKIALLSMVCDYHVDDQLKKIEGILGS